jgi:hypothetical protein
MRILRINGITCDIDESTSIGLTVQNYDVKEPAKSKVKLSNSFTLPKTTKNLSIFGHVQNPCSESTIAYDLMAVDYWVDNVKLVDTARCMLQSISERIEVLFFQKSEFTDIVKDVSFNDMLSDYFFNYIGAPSSEATKSTELYNFFVDRANAGNVSFDKPNTYAPNYWGFNIRPSFGEISLLPKEYPTYAVLQFIPDSLKAILYIQPAYGECEIVKAVSSGISTIKIDGSSYNDGIKVLGGNSYEVEVTLPENGTYGEISFSILVRPNYFYEGVSSQIFNVLNSVTWQVDNSKPKDIYGNHVNIYAYGVLEYLKWKYNVEFTGNVFDTDFIKSIYVPVKSLIVHVSHDAYYNESYWLVTNYYGYWFKHTGDGHKDKSVYDFLIALFQTLDVAVDNYAPNKYSINYMSKINESEIIDFGELSGDFKFKPIIDGYGQKSIIKYKSVYEGLPELTGAKIINCDNKNLNFIEDLFEIDAYRPAIANNFIDMSYKAAGDNFIFLADSGTLRQVNYITTYDGNITSPRVTSYNRMRTISVQMPSIVSLDYQFLQLLATKPKVYEVKKYISLEFFMRLKTYARYWINELNGIFYLNKISNFNPQNSTQPTTFEFIKISGGMPGNLPSDTENFFTDGVNNIFTDGNNENFK